MGYLEYLKLNPDYEATAAAADALRRAASRPCRAATALISLP